jgi:hypothetical protein
MKRRDFNRLALGIGLSPMLSDRSLAQWYEGPSPPTQAPPQKFNIVIKHSPRTYNQVNVPRKPAAGRRFTIYWTWSYPWEANRDLTELNNRFSTMTEVRRVAWPNYEIPEYSEKEVLKLDCDGRLISRYEYGKLSTLGWQIDHIIPVSVGGSNAPWNLRARHHLGNPAAGRLGGTLAQKFGV